MIVVTAVRVFVGLGNPGVRYADTRHNAGFWFLERLAGTVGIPLRLEQRLGVRMGQGELAGERILLALPETWMNESGRPVRALLDYFRIPPQHLLVAHDDLDLPPGTVRLKRDGGHGGHNGVRDLIAHLGHGDFARLRIGIGHPGARDRVTPWVLSAPSPEDRARIEQALSRALTVVEELVRGQWGKAQQSLHAPATEREEAAPERALGARGRADGA